jgi:hypothetical protein
VSKHGGRGRYNAILEFKGSKFKKNYEKENEKMRKKKQRKNIYVWKKYNISMCKNKIK